MNLTPEPRDSTTQSMPTELADIYDMLGITGDDHVSICWIPPGDRDDMHVRVRTPDTAVELAGELADLGDRDCWFGINPVDLPVNPKGTYGRCRRGTEDEVTRIVALYADLDVKPDACGDLETAHAIIDDISALLHERPVCVIASGGGLQPLWAVEGCDPITGRKLLRRFKRLVNQVAKDHKVKVDAVFDMARVLRVPGTLNHKYDPPRRVELIPDTGSPMTPYAVSEWLDEIGIYEMDDDGAILGEVVCDSTRWTFSGDWCGYSKRAVENWQHDIPPNGRHPFMLGKLVRLACMWRYGCIPNRTALDDALNGIAERHELRCATTEPKRNLKRYEMSGAWTWAVDQTARKSDQQVLQELGDHDHDDAPIGAGELGETSDSASEHNEFDRVLRLVPASDIVSDIPDWIWETEDKGRIQRGVLTLFAGRPEAGKSTAARWFAAQWSNGRLPGCWMGKPQKVAYIASEEALEFVVKPGLQMADADLNNFVFPEVKMNGEAIALMSDTDESELTKQLKAKGITVVVVDPIMATIRSKVDIYRNNEAREALAPWVRIAKGINGTVIGVVHLVKGNSRDVVASVNGSSAFGEVARCVFGFAKDPECEPERVMSQAKNSCGCDDLSLTYEIEAQLFTADSGRRGLMPVFKITGNSDITVSDILAAGNGKRPLSPTAQRVLDLVNSRDETHAAIVVDKGLAKTNNAASKTLNRLYQRGYIDNPLYGSYCPKATPKAGK